eukprot:TRINITY_DN685_c0_g1_i1.p1 TRINITY_DN685_c0_g1~~TRINITY_DN685_c0_g1_i1.p1  ORF type:complete len:740 (-),score=220.20 TRINITY_DN685_c0_g1_i1:182-2401(-)
MSSTNTVAISTLSATPTTPSSPILTNPNDVEEALIKQVEYYFSRQNLATDHFLVSQMNGEMWVPISVIAGFKKVSALTTDPNVIAKTLSHSTNVVVDSARLLIRPNFKLQRNTIILRDIPSSTPVEEVKAIFEPATTLDGSEKPVGGEAQANSALSVTSVRADIQDTWFVSFASEEMAQDALFFVRDKQFRGKPIKARMKSENLLRSVYVAPEGTATTTTPAGVTPQQPAYYNNSRNGPVVNGHFAPPYQGGGNRRQPSSNYQNTQGIVSQTSSTSYPYSNNWEGQEYNNYYSYRGNYDKDRRGYKGGRNPRPNQQPTSAQGLIPNPPITSNTHSTSQPATATSPTSPNSNGTGLLNPNTTGAKIEGKDQSKGRQYNNSRSQSYNQSYSQQPPSQHSNTTSSSSTSSQTQSIPDDRKKGKGKNRGKGQNAPSTQTPTSTSTQGNSTVPSHTRSVPLTAQHFPPLSGKTAGTFRVGYTQDYRSFTPQDILGIVKDLPASQSLPDSFPKDSIALSQSPNTTPEIASNPLLVLPQTPEPFSPSSPHINEPPKAPQWPIKKSSPALQPQHPHPVANPPAATQKKKAPAPQQQNPSKKGENEKEKDKSADNNGANGGQRDHNRKPKDDGRKKGPRKEREFDGNESKQQAPSANKPTSTTTAATLTPPVTTAAPVSPSLNSSSNTVPTSTAQNTASPLATSTEEKKSSLPTFADIVRTSSPPIRVPTPQGAEKPKTSPPASPLLG